MVSLHFGIYFGTFLMEFRVEWNEMIRVPVAVVDGQVSQDLIKVELYHKRESFFGISRSEGDLIGWLQFR
jgi:hypothetical protein